MGRLTGKYSKANPPPSGRGFSNVNMTELEPMLETMRRVAGEHNVSVSSVALNYVICKGKFILHLKRQFRSPLSTHPLQDTHCILFFQVSSRWVELVMLNKPNKMLVLWDGD